MNSPSPLARFRISLLLFIVGLVLSGVTAFPLLTELRLLGSIVEGSQSSLLAGSGVRDWVLHVRDGLENTYAQYPWVAYGTDWLGFGHLVIAMFFFLPLRDPIGGRQILIVGVIACAAVIPFTLIAGAVRQIPFYWRLIDCSFGVFGMIPLLYCLRLLPQISEALPRQQAAREIA